MADPQPAETKEQIIDPRNGMNELAAVLSTPMGARTVQCQPNFGLRDVLVCLRGGVVSAVFSCALFLFAARNFMLNLLVPAGTVHAGGGIWGGLEMAFWMCFVTGFILLIVYSLDNRRSLTIDPFGLIINTQVHEGVETRLLVPWHWLSKVSIKQPKTAFGGTEFHMETKYGMTYALRWDEVQSSTVTETLVAALRTLAPQAVIDLGLVQHERVIAQDSFTELWLRSLASSATRVRSGELPPGTTLGGERYRVHGVLGAGGQGTAYLATDLKDNVDVVLKEYVLPAHGGSDVLSASQLRISREIALMKSLDNPNIVRLIDNFTEDYRGYLVLEFVKGSQLKEQVDKLGAFSEQEVVRIGIEVCGILSYLHGLKPQVVHQDITPDNLIMQEDSTVKLVDFNVARRFAGGGSGLVVVGKQAYIPPEQFRGKATPQSDIYALGCSLYFLLTAKEPEPMTSSRPARVRDDVSAELDKIITKATSLNTHDRYSTAQDFSDALKALAPKALKI